MEITTTTASERLRLTPQRVRELIRSGLLPARRIGRDWLILEDDLTEFAKLERKAGKRREKSHESNLSR